MYAATLFGAYIRRGDASGKGLGWDPFSRMEHEQQVDTPNAEILPINKIETCVPKNCHIGHLKLWWGILYL